MNKPLDNSPTPDQLNDHSSTWTRPAAPNPPKQGGKETPQYLLSKCAVWVNGCITCNPDGDGYTRGIPPEYIRTIVLMREWFPHYLGKTWCDVEVAVRVVHMASERYSLDPEEVRLLISDLRNKVVR